jgi:hypothetical protein
MPCCAVLCCLVLSCAVLFCSHRKAGKQAGELVSAYAPLYL